MELISQEILPFNIVRWIGWEDRICTRSREKKWSKVGNNFYEQVGRMILRNKWLIEKDARQILESDKTGRARQWKSNDT